jgi:hypothetical protein
LLADLAHKLRVTHGFDDEGHASISRTLTALVEHARTAGFQVGKLSRRIEVDGEKAPDSAKLARVGLSGGFEAAGPYLFSLSSSIAHGSGLGIIEMSEVTDLDHLTLVLRLRPGDAALTVTAGVLAHGLGFRELSRLLGFQLPTDWTSARTDLLGLASKCLEQAAENEC